MMRIVMRKSTIALVAAAFLAWVANAQSNELLPNISPPILLQLEGTMHAAPDVARKAGFTMLSLGFYGHEDAHRYFGVDDARTVGPDTALDGKDVLDELAPLRPNLMVTGPQAMVETLRDLPEGKRVRMEGLVRRGSRTYYLRSLEVDPQPQRHSGVGDRRDDDLAVTLAGAAGGEHGR